MADRYAILTTGAHNSSDTATWSSTADGLTTPASVPTSVDNVYISAICQAGATLTIDAVLNCLNMDWTGATNSPALVQAAHVNLYGNLTTIAAMSWTGAFILYTEGSGGTSTLTTNGLYINNSRIASDAGTLALGDDLHCNRLVHGRPFNSGGFTVTCNEFEKLDAAVITWTLTNSTINCTSFTVGFANLTLVATGSTIKVSGTGAFTGNGLTYNDVELIGTAHTITGNNTFASLAFKPSGAQTITGTGVTQTFGNMHRTGLGTITLVNGTYTKTGGGRIGLYKMSISGSTFNPANAGYAGYGSVDGGGNTGWIFLDSPDRNRETQRVAEMIMEGIV